MKTLNIVFIIFVGAALGLGFIAATNWVWEYISLNPAHNSIHGGFNEGAILLLLILAGFATPSKTR